MDRAAQHAASKERSELYNGRTAVCCPRASARADLYQGVTVPISEKSPASA